MAGCSSVSSDQARPLSKAAIPQSSMTARWPTDGQNHRPGRSGISMFPFQASYFRSRVWRRPFVTYMPDRSGTSSPSPGFSPDNRDGTATVTAIKRLERQTSRFEICLVCCMLVILIRTQNAR